MPKDAGKVNLLPNALPDFLKPHPWIGAVNYATEKAQKFGGIVAVSPNVVLSDLGV